MVDGMKVQLINDYPVPNMFDEQLALAVAMNVVIAILRDDSPSDPGEQEPLSP